MPSSKKSITNIQILRALAALSVVVAHASSQFTSAPVIPRIQTAQAGVDVFFVISGFIMVYVTASRQQSSTEFLSNRIIRIVPNYWFYTLLTAVVALFAPSVFRGTSLGLKHLALSMFFIAHPNPALANSTSPLLRPGWTLNYEMFFYAIFSFALLWYRNRVAIAVAVISLLVVVGAVVPHRGLVFDFYTRDIMLEFVLGMLLAVAYLRGLPKLPAPLLLVGILGGAAVMVLSPDVAEGQNAIRGFFWGLPALVIVASGLMLEGRMPKTGGALLQKLGDASYTIYLSHPFTVAISRVIFTRLGLRPSTILGELLFIALAVVVAAILGCTAYRLIEVNLIRASKSIVVRERSKPALVSA